MLSKGFTSCTHFLDADNGLEDSYTYLSDDGEKLGVDFEFDVGPIPNSYKKALKYIDGDYSEMWCSESMYILGTRATTHFAWKRPFSLFELYHGTETRMYLQGYLNYDSGNEGWENADDPSSTADPNFYISLANMHTKHAYTTLGRICHLLEDNSMPVHVHNVSHAGIDGMYYDTYEEDILTDTYITNLLATHQLDTYIDPYIAGLSDNQDVGPIEYLFYCQNQIADVLDDGKVNGDTNYSTDYPKLNDYINEINSKPTLELKREYLVESSIKFTAGLLYWFLVESGQLCKVNYYHNGEFS
ncbi:MAG: hypothetical protein KAS62_02300, partial [Candidatus Delongbacteria bacterium]|nr:hypothetical protein [Candidatus Delongbacteria bacterium]